MTKCSVCGYENIADNDVQCPCCELNYGVGNPAGARAIWVSEGLPWRPGRETQPDNYSPFQQLLSIPDVDMPALFPTVEMTQAQYDELRNDEKGRARRMQARNEAFAAEMTRTNGAVERALEEQVRREARNQELLALREQRRLEKQNPGGDHG